MKKLNMLIVMWSEVLGFDEWNIEDIEVLGNVLNEVIDFRRFLL